MSLLDTKKKAPRTASRSALRLRLLLLPVAAFVVTFLVAQALATEAITVEGQFDSAPLNEALNQAGLKGASEAANTISLQFPKEGGPVTGDFALEFENFPIGAVLVGVGQAVGEGIAGSIAGVFGGEDATPESGPPPTPTPKERILMSCTSTMSLTGTLTGSYDPVTQKLTGDAEVIGSVYKDLRCSEPIPGVTDTPQQSSVATSTWEATFDGERLVVGTIAPATEGATQLAFQAEVLAPVPPAGGTGAGPSGKPSSEAGAGTVGETGLVSRVLRPGSRMPSIDNTAAASAFLGATATLMSLGVLRQPRTPRVIQEGSEIAGAATAAAQYIAAPGPNVQKWLEGRTEAEVQKASRSMLRRMGLSSNAIREIGTDAPRVAANLLRSAPNVNVLAQNVRDELLNNERLANQVLRDSGLTPIQIRLLGGPKRIVRNTERLLRNPPRAIGELLRDTARNLRRPDRLIKRAGRLVLDSNPVTSFIGRAFGLFGMR